MHSLKQWREKLPFNEQIKLLEDGIPVVELQDLHTDWSLKHLVRLDAKAIDDLLGDQKLVVHYQCPLPRVEAVKELNFDADPSLRDSRVLDLKAP